MHKPNKYIYTKK